MNSLVKIQARRLPIALIALMVSFTSSFATIMAPAPEFGEMTNSAAFVGVIEIVAAPKEPARGFRADKPPLVNVRTTESLIGMTNGVELNVSWGSGLRYDKLVSYGVVPLADPREVRIKPPLTGERWFVFLESLPDGSCRDVYGWRRTRVYQSLSDATRDWYGRPSGWKVLSINSNRVFQISKAPSSYNRQRFDYKAVSPVDVRHKLALEHYEIEEPGKYWVINDRDAFILEYMGKDTNPYWPYKHVVQDGETLSGIASKHYGEPKWQLVFTANRRVISDPTRIKRGMLLVIPPEPESR